MAIHTLPRYQTVERFTPLPTQGSSFFLVELFDVHLPCVDMIPSSFSSPTILTTDEPGSNLLPLIVGASVGGALLAVILAVLCIVCLCIWSVNVSLFFHLSLPPSLPPSLSLSLECQCESTRVLSVFIGKERIRDVCIYSFLHTVYCNHTIR